MCVKSYTTLRSICRAGVGAPWVKGLAAMTDDPSSIPRKHGKVKRENGLPKEGCPLTSTRAAFSLRRGVLTQPVFDALRGCVPISQLSLCGGQADCPLRVSSKAAWVVRKYRPLRRKNWAGNSGESNKPSQHKSWWMSMRDGPGGTLVS